MNKNADKQMVAFLDDSGNSITYGEIETEGKELCKTAGGRCLLFSFCQNTIGSAFGYAAFIRNSIVPVMLNANIDKEQLEYLLDAYRPSYLWMPENHTNDFRETDIVYEKYGYALLRTRYEITYSLHKDLALLLTTSGSTGSPKLVRQSYKNIKANTDSIITYLGIDSNERPITTLPMNYTYGLSIINTHLASGATILLTDASLMQKEFWDFLKTEKATSFGGVPYTYEMLDRLRFFRMDLPYLKTMTQAGGKLTPELHEKFAKYAAENNKCFVVMYGQCEATARMGYLPPEKAVEKKGSMGIAIPGGTFTLVDINGEQIQKPYTAGELIYEGDNVTLGYAEKAEDLSKGDERNGTLETGDMAQFDEDGYYYIVGRKKRFLKIYGNRVNLDEIDRLVNGHFDTDIVSAGVDDHMYLFITDATLADRIKEYVANTTKLNPAAFRIIIIDEIPRNESGKVRYTELEKYYDI